MPNQFDYSFLQKGIIKLIGMNSNNENNGLINEND